MQAIKNKVAEIQQVLYKKTRLVLFISIIFCLAGFVIRAMDYICYYNMDWDSCGGITTSNIIGICAIFLIVIGVGFAVWCIRGMPVIRHEEEGSLQVE